VNYLQCFITNLAGKIEPLLPLVRLKHEKGFMWSAAQREAFDRIMEYLRKPPVLCTPREGVAYRLYIAATDRTLGAVLMQNHAGKEFVVAFLSGRMIDAETRYTRIEKLCLSLYYACSKFRHYILSSLCVVTCQHDVVRHMIQKLILRRRMGKWVYALIEYELTYEQLRAVKGQIMADFIVDHNIEIDDVSLVAVNPWQLFFDGSVCSQGCGIGCVLALPNVIKYEVCARLEHKCINNQAEYEGLLASLELLAEMQVMNMEAFRDSKLVVQQVLGEAQCLDGELNQYREACLALVRNMDTFRIRYVPSEENEAPNELARQASGYMVR
jgi:ribonuclease HI